MVNSCGLALVLGHVAFRVKMMFLVRVNIEFNILFFSKLKKVMFETTEGLIFSRI